MPQTTVLLIGPHNTGKSTVFNRLTNSKSKIMNYPGSTVHFSVGNLTGNNQIQIIDTPGIVSLNPRSEDETVTIQCLMNLDQLVPGASPHPDYVVCVIDPTQLARQLSLYAQLNEIGLKPHLVLTMADIVKENIDLDTLQSRLPASVSLVSGMTGDGMKSLCDKLESAPIHNASVIKNPSLRDQQINESYQWADQVAHQIYTPHQSSTAIDIDRWVLHPFWGTILFLLTMTGLFWALFSLVTPLMDGVEYSFGLLTEMVARWMPVGIIGDFVTQGVINSMAGVIVFVPQIWMLFFIIGILENSGYLARGAALVDRPLAAIGLNGRSFMPLLSGFACAVPSMMAARTISNRRERLLTILIIPLMSCSARLPVYGLLVSLLVLNQSAWVGGALMTGIYLVSILIATIIASLINQLLPKQQASTFYIELPKWRMPSIRQIVKHANTSTTNFITSAGPIILGLGVGLWVLSTFPSTDQSWAKSLGQYLDPIWAPMGVDWRVGFALLLSFAAREVFVSALAVVFAIDAASPYLLTTLAQATLPSGEILFSLPTIIGLVLFFMISMQCVSTIAVAKQEIGGWKYPALITAGYIGLGYVAAVVTVQLLH